MKFNSEPIGYTINPYSLEQINKMLSHIYEAYAIAHDLSPIQTNDSIYSLERDDKNNSGHYQYYFTLQFAEPEKYILISSLEPMRNYADVLRQGIQALDKVFKDGLPENEELQDDIDICF